MEDTKEQGIFIPLEIWTIKNLNINEKLVLSDILNKSKLKGFNGYNKKAETISQDLFILEDVAKDILNTLQKKGYIKSNSEIYRNKGVFKKTLAHRQIIQENFLNAERFIIPEENIFLRNGSRGVFLNRGDIKILNLWGVDKKNKAGKNKRLASKTRTRHLILILIIRKIAFISKNTLEVFARFKIKDISEFMGIDRKTISKYTVGYTYKKNDEIHLGLIEKQTYNGKPIRLLYKLSDEEAYQELYSKLGDTTILTEYKKNSKEIKVFTAEGEEKEVSIGNLDGLYYINIYDMQNIGLDIDIGQKIIKGSK